MGEFVVNVVGCKVKKYRKPQKNLTPIGTIIHNMQLIQYLEMVDFDSDRRREFLIKCLCLMLVIMKLTITVDL